MLLLFNIISHSSCFFFLNPTPPNPQKSLRICENLMGAFFEVGGFEPTQTHPWPRHCTPSWITERHYYYGTAGTCKREVGAERVENGVNQSKKNQSKHFIVQNESTISYKINIKSISNWVSSTREPAEASF